MTLFCPLIVLICIISSCYLSRKTTVQISQLYLNGPGGILPNDPTF